MVKDDLVAKVADLSHEDFLDLGSNAPFNTLIPKIKGFNNIEDSRSIILVDSVYKILKEVLAGRLKEVLSSIISPNQKALIKERLSPDEVLVANESTDSITRSGEMNMFCKMT